MLAVFLSTTEVTFAQKTGSGKRNPGERSTSGTGFKKESDSSRPARGRKGKGSLEGGPADYTSRHFLLHTDLPPKEAQELLKRLETMLGLISKYWGRAPVGIIECYVVKDLNKWSEQVLEPGIDSIRGRAGVTQTEVMSMGQAFRAKATVYAIADRGTPLHEAVHAYCGQAFGRVGPTWYSEGMAEMGHYWKENDLSVNASDYVITYLRSEEPKPLLEIVRSDQVTGDSWQNYAWRWALCHLLANNPNYAARFRPLGLGLLMKQDVSFEQTYGNMEKEIDFEYKLFLKDLKKGYRADLCGWDWKAKSRRDRTGNPLVAKIDAGRGWQPSRLTVVKDEEYEYSVTGTWASGREVANSNLTADGTADGKGRLTGILFQDYKLSDPFPLGEFGTFTAPADGDLYLRCQDDWASLGDNKGKVVVKLKVKGKGKPLSPPKKEPEKPEAATKGKEREKSGDSDKSSEK
jgi:hypothetical protein